MTKKVELPQMGESVDAGTVLSVLVSKGDSVEEGDGLLEVETDKATTEIPSPASGVVEEIHVGEGDEVETGQLIVTLGAGGGGDEEADEDEDEDDVSEDEDSEDSDEADEDDDDEEVDDDEDDDDEEADEDDERDESSKDAQPAEPAAGRRPRRRAFAAPTVRRFARELGVSPEDVAGSGRGGQISEGDVKAHVRALLADGRSSAHTGAELPDFEEWGEIDRQPMSALRRRTAEVVGHSWRDVPHVTQHDRADVTDLDSFRERFRAGVEEAGGKLTLTAILIKVATEALGHFPRFNASVDEPRAELIFKRYVHVGVAVDTENGLLVPVIRDASSKSLTQIAIELSELADKARAGRIAPEELQGASFTVSNLGGMGTTHFSPIVPWPQAAILAVGRAEPVPAIRDGKLVERRMLPIGVAYDHRCVDGADAARFLRWIAEVLEEPMRITMAPGE